MGDPKGKARGLAEGRLGAGGGNSTEVSKGREAMRMRPSPEQGDTQQARYRRRVVNSTESVRLEGGAAAHGLEGSTRGNSKCYGWDRVGISNRVHMTCQARVKPRGLRPSKSLDAE